MAWPGTGLPSFTAGGMRVLSSFLPERLVGGLLASAGLGSASIQQRRKRRGAALAHCSAADILWQCAVFVAAQQFTCGQWQVIGGGGGVLSVCLIIISEELTDSWLHLVTLLQMLWFICSVVSSRAPVFASPCYGLDMMSCTFRLAYCSLTRS